MVTGVDSLRQLCVLQLEFFHIWLDFAYLQKLFLLVSLIKDSGTLVSMSDLRFHSKDLAFDLGGCSPGFLILSGCHIHNIFLFFFLLDRDLISLFLIKLFRLRGRHPNLLFDFPKFWFDSLNFLQKNLLHLRLIGSFT